MTKLQKKRLRKEMKTIREFYPVLNLALTKAVNRMYAEILANAWCDPEERAKLFRIDKSQTRLSA